MNYTLQKHLAYNLWANTNFAEALKHTEEELFDKEVASSFPSLQKTVCHMWDAESIWLSRINGVSPSVWPSQTFNGTRDQCLDGFLDISKNLSDFFVGKDNTFCAQTISFKTMHGDDASETIEGIIFHVVNHGSFHRGQLATMLRALGINQVPVSDLIRYLRQS
ncbi:MAG: DinB family protein [Bacteroidota bacterium]